MFYTYPTLKCSSKLSCILSFRFTFYPRHLVSFVKQQSNFYKKNLIKKIFTLTALILFISLNCLAQAPVIEWQKCFGGSGSDEAYSIQQTSDGGYIVVGMTFSNDGDVSGLHVGIYSYSDIWIVKLDATGNIQWQKCLGGSRRDYANSIQQTSDGGYIIAGVSYSDDGDVSGNHGESDCWIVKLDASGNIQWQRCLGGSDEDDALSIQQTSDGGYIVAGDTRSNDGNVSGLHIDIYNFHDAWIVKLDATGNIQWQRCLGGTKMDGFTSIQQTSDGGYIVAGGTYSNDGDVIGFHEGDPYTNDAWIVKLDATGNIQWQRCLGGSYYDVAYSIQQTSDGGYIVAGVTGSNDGDVIGHHEEGGSYQNHDFWIVKLDVTGNIQWQKCLGGANSEDPNGIQQTSDGGYIVAGFTESNDGDVIGFHEGDPFTTDLWVVKLDASGDIQWQKCLGGSDLDYAYSIQQTSDGGYIVAGGTYSNDGDVIGFHEGGPYISDFWVVKLSNCIAAPTVPSAITGISSICSGATNSYSIAAVSGATDYTWTFPAGWSLVSGQGTTSITVTAGSNSGNITVTANNICGASVPQTFAVTVNPTVTPSVSITSSATNICAGTSVTFAATPTNEGTSPTYQWKKNGTNVGTNSTTYTDAALANEDVITCVLTSNANCATPVSVTSTGITITVNPAVTPSVSITSSATNICSGTSVIFTATPTNGGDSPSYQWKKNGANVGTNSATYSDAALNNGDVITCVLTSDAACATPVSVTSSGINITVSSAVSPAVNITSTATSICTGTNVTFTATPTNGGTAPTYQWKKNGAIVGTNSATYSDAALNNGDVITCVLTSSENCVSSSTALSNAITVTVNPVVVPSVNISTASTTICKGDMVMFNSEVLNAGLSPVYQWQVNGQNTGSNNPVYSSSNLSDNDEVVCMVTPQTNPANCFTGSVSSNIISITINPLPVVTLTPVNAIVSPGTQVHLQGTITGSYQSFSWQPVSGLVDANSLSPVTVPLNEEVQYWLNVISTDGCPVSKNIIIKAQYPLQIPAAFSPNNDGNNDVFRIPPHANFTLNSFFVYNRNGQLVFYTTDINKGWDGRFGSVKQPAGAYIYIITGSDNNGPVYLKGSVVLVR